MDLIALKHANPQEISCDNGKDMQDFSINIMQRHVIVIIIYILNKS